MRSAASRSSTARLGAIGELLDELCDRRHLVQDLAGARSRATATAADRASVDASDAHQHAHEPRSIAVSEYGVTLSASTWA